MGAKPTTIGGGKSTGVASGFADMLNTWMHQGFGAVPGGQQTAGDNLGRANPQGQVSNLTQAFQALLNNGSGMANSAQSIYDIQRKRAVGDIRSRYALGGTGYGTPAAAGEAAYTSMADPQFALGAGQMQMDGISKVLQLLLPMFQQQVDKGTPQATTVMKPSFGGQLLSGLGSLAGAAAPFFGGGGMGGMVASMAGGGGMSAAPAMGNLASMAGAAPKFDMNNFQPSAPSMSWDPRYLANIPTFSGNYRG